MYRFRRVRGWRKLLSRQLAILALSIGGVRLTKPAACDDYAQLAPFVEVQWIIGIVCRYWNAPDVVVGANQLHVALRAVHDFGLRDAVAIFELLSDLSLRFSIHCGDDEDRMSR